MNKILEAIREAITGPMTEMNIIVDSVKYETEGNYNFLRIELDKVNGIDLDTIVAATEVINPIIKPTPTGINIDLANILNCDINNLLCYNFIIIK